MNIEGNTKSDFISFQEKGPVPPEEVGAGLFLHG